MSTYNVPIGTSYYKPYTRSGTRFNGSKTSEFIELTYNCIAIAYPCTYEQTIGDEIPSDTPITAVQATFDVSASSSLSASVYLYNGSIESYTTISDVINGSARSTTISASSYSRSVNASFGNLNYTFNDSLWIVVYFNTEFTNQFFDVERTACSLTYTPAPLQLSATSPVEVEENAELFFTNSLNHVYTVTVKANNVNIITDEVISYSWVEDETYHFYIGTSLDWFTDVGYSGSQLTVTVILKDSNDTSRTAQTTFVLKLPTLIATKSKDEVVLEKTNNVYKGAITLSFQNRLYSYLTLSVKSGQTQITTVSYVGSDSYNLECPFSWFSTLGSTAMSIPIRVDVTDEYGRTAYVTFNLKKPELSLTLSPPQASGGYAEVEFTGRDENVLSVTFSNSSRQLYSTNNWHYDSDYVYCYDTWFEGISSNSQTITVLAEDNMLQRTATRTFTLTAGTGVYPSIHRLEFVDVPYTNMPAEYEFVVGYSRVEVRAYVGAGANGIDTVKLSYPGASNVTMTYKAVGGYYTATTSSVITGNISFSVSVKDTTNRSANSSGTVTATTLPTLSLTVNSANITAGENIVGNVSGFITSYDYDLKYSSTTLASGSGLTTATFTETSESEWFEQVGATGSSISVRVIITDVLGRTAYRDISINLPAFSVSVSPTQVTIDNDATVRIVGMTDQNVTLVFTTVQNGNTITLATVTADESTETVNCPKTWFTDNSLNTISSMTVTVTASYGVKTANYDFTVKFPDLVVRTIGGSAKTAPALFNCEALHRKDERIFVTLKYGSSITLDTFSPTQQSGSDTFMTLAPISFFDTANITTSQTMQINLIVSDVRGRTASTTITLNAGDTMKPTIGTVTLSLVQPSPASETFPSTYIENVSKVKISASYVLPTNAGVKSLTVSYGDVYDVPMTLNQTTGEYEVTTANPITGDTTFTLTIVDVRNLSSSKTSALSNVEPYSSPNVTVNTFYRCNQDKTKNDAGEYCIVNVTYTIEPINNENIKRATLSSTAYSDTQTLTNYTETVEYFFAVDMERSYSIVVTAIDAITSESKTIRLSTAGVIMDFLTGGKGIGLGKVAETQYKVEVNPEWTFESEKMRVRVKSQDGTTDLGLQDLGAFLYALKKRLDDGGL